MDATAATAGHPPVTVRDRPGRHQLDLLGHVVAQRFRARYRRNRLGWLWAIIQPLILMGVYVFVFGALHSLDRVDHYPTYVFIGITAVALFQAGVMSTLSAPAVRQDLILLPGFDRRLVPVAALLSDTIDYLMTVPVLLAFLAFTTGIPATAPLIVVPFLLLQGMILGLGFLLGTANVYVRDVGSLAAPLLRMAFFLSPTFWVEDAIPDRYDWIVDVNPIAGVLTAYREVLMEGDGLPLDRLVPAAVAAAALLVVGLVTYSRASKGFADEL